jgi:RNA polymerase sigma-70 factor, ECF subfamily
VVSVHLEERVRAQFHAHHDFIQRVLRKLGVPSAILDDAAQKVFVTFSQRLCDVDAGRERAFLYGVALRVASDARRAARRERNRRQAAASEPPPPLPAQPDQLLERKRAREVLDGALGALPPDLHKVLVLHELEGKTVREIAALERIPTGTAASRLRRAREAFDAALRRWRASGPGRGMATWMAVPLALKAWLATPKGMAAAALLVGAAVAGGAAYVESRPAIQAAESVSATQSAPRAGTRRARSPREVPVDGPDVAAVAPGSSEATAYEPEPGEAPRARRSPRRRAASAPAPTPAEAPKAAPLSAEIARIDAARRGAWRGEVAAVDAYLRASPKGTFHEQALALRVEALARAGRMEEARAAAAGFSRSFPGSPYGPRVQRWVGEGAR